MSLQSYRELEATREITSRCLRSVMKRTNTNKAAMSMCVN